MTLRIPSLDGGPLRAASLAALALAAVSCGGAPDAPETPSAQPAAAAAPPPPARVEVPELDRPMRGVIDNEALSETIDTWFGAFANKLRIRDFDAVAGAFADGARLERLFPSADSSGHELHTLPLGVQRILLAPPAGVLSPGDFVGALEATIGPWSRVSQSSWRVRSAHFERDRSTELVGASTATVAIHVVGDEVDGGTVVLDARARVRLTNDRGEWRVTHMRFLERSLLRHGDRMFSEVSRAAGVAFDDKRYGEPGNDSDGWNGLGSADVNGDGILDVFVPSASRAFLYMGAGDGTFTEMAQVRGLGHLAGGTGVCFFDYDRDGDQDLAVGMIGWTGLDESLQGRPPQLLRNDGRGYFEDVTEELGLAEIRLPAYSLTAFDADGDGWTDLFACGYGRMEAEINDSWLNARNGASDLLLRNLGGEGFEDVTARAGLVDSDWSYASAAADYDEDGDLDLYVGNNFGRSRLMRNRGDGTFEDAAPELGVDVQGNVMGVLWTDLDGDGRLDLYLASPTSTSGTRILNDVEETIGKGATVGMLQMANGNKVFLGRRAPDGTGAFEDGAGRLGGTRAGWAWSVASPDIDLDGTRDLVCANGFVTGEISGDT